MNSRTVPQRSQLEVRSEGWIHSRHRASAKPQRAATCSCPGLKAKGGADMHVNEYYADIIGTHLNGGRMLIGLLVSPPDWEGISKQISDPMKKT